MGYEQPPPSDLTPVEDSTNDARAASYHRSEPSSSADLDCDQIGGTVYVVGSDPHGFDGDGDGVGCG